MAKYTKQIEQWANIYTDTFINESKDQKVEENDILQGRTHNGHLNEKEENQEIDEATPIYRVDDKYIKDALKLLEPLKTSNPEIYELAQKYLNSHKNSTLVVSPQQFADRRLSNEFNKAPETTDSRSTEDRRAELMKQVADKQKANAPATEIQPQNIKSIWVKDLIINHENEQKSVAKLELEYMDGSKENMDFNIGTTGPGGDYINADRLYKELKRNMPNASDKDIRLSMVRIAFNDYRITWYYGKDKVAAKNWSFDKNTASAATSPVVKANKYAWLEKTNRVVAWKSNSGSTTIYRTEAKKMDESIMSFFSTFVDKFSK